MTLLHRTFPTALISLLMAATLSACGGSDPVPAAEPSFAAVSVTLAHVNDHHSQLEAFANTELMLGGVATQV